MSWKLLLSPQNVGRKSLFKKGCGLLWSTTKRHFSKDIDGTWQNELGSKVKFTTSKNGQLEGTYYSAVGEAEYRYHLSGRYDPEPEGVVLLGWVVAWKNWSGDSHSLTSWSGIYYPKDEVIRTQWLLTSYNLKQEPPQEYWETTMVNHDEFKRIK